MQSRWTDLLSWISATLVILSQQVAQQSWRHRVCGVRRRSILQQRTHPKHSQVWPTDTHQERRGHYHKRQLPWHLALPLGREIGHWPGCGWEWPLGNLRHWGQQRTTGGQPGGRAALHRRGWDVDYKCRSGLSQNLIWLVSRKVICHAWMIYLSDNTSALTNEIQRCCWPSERVT